ncbi:MAG: hypothetical protein EOP85_04530 [Verrucomicrobiaceae bacterium]|nr:MAG: hypothetical protein EOP85_04530 [Verrucomicrobiaceae bacterium]
MEDDSDRPGPPVPKSPTPRLNGPPNEPPEAEPTPDAEGRGATPEETGVPPPIKRDTPLHQHSLNGHSARLKASAVDTKPLLGDFVKLGQATMIYAQANAGKTLTTLALLLEAIEQGRVEAGDILYVNADDSSKGLAEKVEVLEGYGAHMLAPGHRGFKASQFVDKLKEATANGTARGSVVIIDTLKKFTNLMDKGRSSEFAQVCREFVMMGGTIFALGHTAKTPNPDGTPRYQGTTDILEDFDAVYVAEPMGAKPGNDERIIRFTRLKSRAESPEVVAYAYSTEAGLGYGDKVASLRPVYPEELDGHALEMDQIDDQGVVATIRCFLASGHGHVGQDKIVRAMAVNGDISRSQARRVLDRYTGTDPEKHLWNFEKGDRGKRTYFLLKPRPAPEPEA